MEGMISLIIRNSVILSNLATGSGHCMIGEAMFACRWEQLNAEYRLCF